MASRTIELVVLVHCVRGTHHIDNAANLPLTQKSRVHRGVHVADVHVDAAGDVVRSCDPINVHISAEYQIGISAGFPDVILLVIAGFQSGPSESGDCIVECHSHDKEEEGSLLYFIY